MSAGYSGKALHEKLGFQDDTVVWASAPPPHYAELLQPARPVILFDKPEEPVGAIHAFVKTRESLDKLSRSLIDLLATGGMLWISWPKKSSPMFVDLTEDGIRDILLPLGIVDVKVCAVDSDWSGLKFLWRKKMT